MTITKFTAADRSILTTWTIYDRPPHFVVVPFHAYRGCSEPLADAAAATVYDSLEAARAGMISMGRTQFIRDESDDASIVETWI